MSHTRYTVSEHWQFVNKITCIHVCVLAYSIKICISLYLLTCFSLADEEIKSNPELSEIADNFRDQATKLVDMLDISIPVVAKLKVSPG